tara:strand:- start:180 stop:539 length:360 start_codon:yes stop_codon:yes gene_type:complete
MAKSIKYEYSDLQKVTAELLHMAFEGCPNPPKFTNGLCSKTNEPVFAIEIDLKDGEEFADVLFRPNKITISIESDDPCRNGVFRLEQGRGFGFIGQLISGFWRNQPAKALANIRIREGE